MRIPIPFLFIYAVLFLTYACSSPGEDIEPEVETKELVLSIPQELLTDKLAVTFEVLAGNGEYVGRVSETAGEPDAKVSITGNTIRVDLLTQKVVELTITDKQLKTTTVKLRSTDESLKVANFGLHLSQGQTYLMTGVEFGAGGPYTIKSYRGDASTATIEANGIKVTSHKLGNTYYRLKDKRGMVAYFDVSTVLVANLIDSHLELEGKNTMSAQINLPKNTDWHILKSTSKVIESVKIERPIDPKTASHVDFQVLFINTADEGTGTDTVTLENKAGDTAVVSILVR